MPLKMFLKVSSIHINMLAETFFYWLLSVLNFVYCESSSNCTPGLSVTFVSRANVCWELTNFFFLLPEILLRRPFFFLLPILSVPSASESSGHQLLCSHAPPEASESSPGCSEQLVGLTGCNYHQGLPTCGSSSGISHQPFTWGRSSLTDSRTFTAIVSQGVLLFPILQVDFFIFMLYKPAFTFFMCSSHTKFWAIFQFHCLGYKFFSYI